ncbi:MAG TPA: hypothetical protein VG122_21510, partial [Gemmata sp.]|nr:hypothetical protein [Gemmata sp.]
SSLALTIDGVQLADEPTIQVKAGAVNGSKTTVGFAAGSVVSGTTDTTTILLEDAAGNAISGLKNSAFVLAFARGTSTGAFGRVTETTTPGTYMTAFTGVLAGTASKLILKVNGIVIATHPSIQVTSAAPSGGKSLVRFAASTVTSGKTDQLIIAVKDPAGNAITDLTNSDFALHFSSGTSTGSFGTVTETATHGTYTVPFTGTLAGTASALTVTVDSVQLNTQPKVRVNAGHVSGSTSSVSFAASTVASGTTELATIVVEDAAGNVITGLPGSAFALSLSKGMSTGSFGTVIATTTPGTYTASFTGMIAGTVRALTVKVNGVQLITQPTIQVMPGTVNGAKSTVTFATSAVISGNTDTLTIVVKDAAGNAITGLPESVFDLGLSGGTSTGSFTTVSETQTPGTYTVVFTGAIAGTASTLSAKVSGVQFLKQPKVTVTT